MDFATLRRTIFHMVVSAIGIAAFVGCVLFLEHIDYVSQSWEKLLIGFAIVEYIHYWSSVVSKNHASLLSSSKDQTQA